MHQVKNLIQQPLIKIPVFQYCQGLFLHIVEQFLIHFSGRQNEICTARGYGTIGHPIKFCRFRVLNNDHSSAFLDALDPFCPVCSRAR
ncbi:hypothetical protein D3C87_1527070 [compost metagenome]